MPETKCCTQVANTDGQRGKWAGDGASKEEGGSDWKKMGVKEPGMTQWNSVLHYSSLNQGSLQTR